MSIYINKNQKRFLLIPEYERLWNSQMQQINVNLWEVLAQLHPKALDEHLTLGGQLFNSPFQKEPDCKCCPTTQHDLLRHTRSKRRRERSKTQDWKSIAPLREMPEKNNLLLIKKNQEAAFFSYRSKWETNCFLPPGQMDWKNQNKPCAYI